jgi:methionyl-tRNA formyltransferase
MTAHLILAANGDLGLAAARALVQRMAYTTLEEYPISLDAVLVHPPERETHAKEIARQAPRSIVWTPTDLPAMRRQIREVGCDCLLSVGFGYILPAEVLGLFDRAINVHTGHLPSNRGANTNVWPFLDGTPAGVTSLGQGCPLRKLGGELPPFRYPYLNVA